MNFKSYLLTIILIFSCLLILFYSYFINSHSVTGNYTADPAHNITRETGRPLMMTKSESELNIATFAGGCFWCVEKAFESVDGVSKVLSGYTGGSVVNPSYKDVMTGTTGHYEAIQVYYDDSIVSYFQLLDVFWRNIDPTDEIGQFADKGPQYRTAIFYHDDVQLKLATKSKQDLIASKQFEKPIVTDLLGYDVFYEAETYHQDYYKKKPVDYGRYAYFSGRHTFLKEAWSNTSTQQKEMKYVKPDDDDIRALLTDIQYEVTQKEGTEQPFKNLYWNNKEEGIYVDIVSGEPLFSSRDKFESGTGWPCFTRAINDYYITEHTDSRFGMQRVEVRSRIGESHLGHVFPDGPEPNGIRYCINSASLRFVSKEDLEKEGYGEYLKLFH